MRTAFKQLTVVVLLPLLKAVDEKHSGPPSFDEYRAAFDRYLVTMFYAGFAPDLSRLLRMKRRPWTPTLDDIISRYWALDNKMAQHLFVQIRGELEKQDVE